MRRLAPLRTRALSLVLLLSSSLSATAGCSGGRDAHDVAADIEGTVSSQMVERVLRDVDLARSPLVISASGQETDARFGGEDQPALESFVRDVASELDGDRLHVTQQSVEDTGEGTQRLTVTVAVDHEGRTRYVPVALDLLRDGRRMLVTRVRVMAR